MLTIGNNQYRNLQEQVLQNQDQIEILKSQKTISDLGINIITPTPLTAASDLPYNYTGAFGDAYLVGTEAPFDLYIWTRSNQPGITGYWFDWGPLNAPSTVPGPKGEKGDTGDTGTPGSKWYTGPNLPSSGVYNVGDMFLRDDGTVFRYTSTGWINTGSIRGPQGIPGIKGDPGVIGPQGPQGPQGLPGSNGQSFRIVGTLDNTDQLPIPTEAILTNGYLVGSTKPYDLYVITGEAGNYLWENVGEISGVQGETGPQGPQGIRGETGIHKPWYWAPADSIIPNSTSTIDISLLNPSNPAPEVNDMFTCSGPIIEESTQPGSEFTYYIDFYRITGVNGTTLTIDRMYRFTGTRGPQGIQGVSGPKGVDGSQLFICSTSVSGGAVNAINLVPKGYTIRIGSLILSGSNLYYVDEDPAYTTISGQSGLVYVTNTGFSPTIGPKGSAGIMYVSSVPFEYGSVAGGYYVTTDVDNIYPNDPQITIDQTIVDSTGTLYQVIKDPYISAGNKINIVANQLPKYAQVIKGEKGDTGEQGPQGEVGPQGPQGIQGPAGPIGEKGETGEAGPQGPKGDIGKTGPQGSQGIQGETGPQGPQGIQGIQGPKGDTGATGPQGPKGEQGVQGEVGPQGPAGKDGVSINIKEGIYTTETLPEFSTTSVNDGYIVRDTSGRYDLYMHNSGSTTWNIVDDWGGVPGPKGDKGDVGPQGPIGPAGSAGKDGAAGEQGPQGIQGPAGPVGPKGDKGDSGEKGEQGIQGPKGDAGPAGPQGIQGEVGPTGPTGPQGEPGVDGANGINGIDALVCNRMYEKSNSSETPMEDIVSVTLSYSDFNRQPYPTETFLLSFKFITYNYKTLSYIALMSVDSVDPAALSCTCMIENYVSTTGATGPAGTYTGPVFEIVTTLPASPVDNTIYFVTGE